MNFSRYVWRFLLGVCAWSDLSAQSGVSITGKIDHGRYFSPTTAFDVQLPVLPELGGIITDTDNVVTFQDSFNIHASIACFRMDATQRWENETRGRKDYLVWFFSNFLQSDFQRRFPGAKVETARFMPATMDGALMVSNLLPGGSMFADKVILGIEKDPLVAKRGNLLFVRNEHIFVLSIELAEKVLTRSTYNKTTEQEDDILRERLISLLAKITFADSAHAAK